MKGPWDEDSDPLSALREGDSSVFEAFVEAMFDRLRGHFLRLGAERAEAEDLTQEVFLKLFRSASSYQPRDRFLPYVFRVAQNAWIDRRRRRGALHASGFGDEDGGDLTDRTPDEQPSALEGLSRTEEAGRVRGAMRKLSPPHRVVFELGVVQELPYTQISELLEIPVGTVKSRMFHAVRKLRELLGEEPRP